MVRHENYISNSIHVTSGVPQGVHLKPLLFSIFINDISKVVICSNILSFADNVKIFKELQTVKDTVVLQSDLNKIYAWCKRNNILEYR